MTDQEMEMWQRIDIMNDRIEELEQKIDDQTRSFTIAVNLIADLLKEQKSGA